MPTESTARPSAGSIIAAALVLIYLASLVLTAFTSPDGLQVSADPDAARMPLWAVLLPSAAGIILTALLPARAYNQPAFPDEPGRLRLTTVLLLALAVLYPLLSRLLPLIPEDVILLKFVMLLVIPGILVLVLRRAVVIERTDGAWRWWAPGIVILVWFALSQLAPWNPPFDASGIDRTYLIMAAIATAITAGIGEELFFRRWLQTRLEALITPAAGLGLASLLFALMHFSTHSSSGAGEYGSWQVLIDAARMIVVQGTFGVMLGLMWLRYRNLLAIILVHLLVNGWGVLVALVA